MSALITQGAGLFARGALGALTGGGGPLGGGGGPNVSSTSDFNSPITQGGTNVINVASPLGNLGEILRPYSEGSFENGGFGMQPLSRYASFPPTIGGRSHVTAAGVSVKALDSSASLNFGMIGLIAVGAAAFFLLR